MATHQAKEERTSAESWQDVYTTLDRKILFDSTPHSLMLALLIQNKPPFLPLLERNKTQKVHVIHTKRSNA